MKIRQGRDIVLVWNLYKLVKSTSIIDGEITERTPVDLDTALDIVVTLKHRVYGSFSKVLTVTAVGNQITAEITPTEQTYLGDYYLIITLNHLDASLPDGKRRFTADAPAYTVVGATEEEDTEDETTVTSTSVFGFEGLSSYELAVRYGLYSGTEEEYAALIPDATEASEAATLAANNAATLANEKAGLADSKATLANEAASKADIATAAAEEATGLSETATAAANTATGLANTATANANAATDAATEATGLANTATANANAATDAATEATEWANTAAQTADTKAALADSKATAANEAAGAANAAKDLTVTATTNANNATLAANTAANLANEKAGLAEEKAGLANTAATNANQIAASALMKAAADDNEFKATAEALCFLEARIQALEKFIENARFDKLTVDTLDVVEQFNNYKGSYTELQGAGAPTVIPDKIFQKYLDTTNNVLYEAKGNTSVSDWKQTSN